MILFRRTLALVLIALALALPASAQFTTNPQNFSVASMGSTLGLNNVGTTGAQVIPFDPGRRTIVFANPNASVTIYVYQLTDLNGHALAPTNASPGGAWPIFAGAIATFTGDVQGAWGAFASTGSTNSISIMSSRS
jgi:hypothetical protein